MSLLKLFGKKSGKKDKSKKSTAPSLSEVIREFKDTQEALNKKQNYLESKIKTEIANARKHATKNKKAALQALARKKRYEKQLQQIDSTLTTLESQIDILENANINNVAVTSMKQASDALKNAQKFTDVEKIDGLLNDLADQRENVDEISQVLSKANSEFERDFDEEELERELELLEIDGDAEQVEIVKIPAVPGKDESVEKPKSISEPKRSEKGKEAMAAA